ncbi:MULTISPECIES: PorH family porin [Corynebacterium]|uniref:Uncharacterized protein n=1 Tax=Corynebacterium minutissimum TaxID=38301 RepID=A0ACC4UEF2_9CORY|nr:MULTISPECIES: PorH family porin [Corynebacterium]KKO81417.1 hypothetical protein WU87_01635 [Corynebacterium minutissimum]OFK64850.1 hypothetical protein HMPREF2806_03320 [Corynebacterium sp. HMSC076G08]OFK67555.1 hypothetical protein HMPREF2807_05950 [Corynebacterium sp. HMSC074A09]OFN73686.1 hypothetical protein HMPREF2526_05335 [Corynebacterium sp. HMSC070E08]OFO22711.1 hypothetical protein HMPREF3056_06535 [Corynebacterium sp. HMSC056F09]
MDLSFVADQLGNFADFASGIKNLFQGFAKAFDIIAGAATADSVEVTPDTSKLDALSSTK